MNVLPNNDGKRLAGPANSLPYSVYQVKEETSQENRMRSEGREDDAHRKMFLSTGVICRAKGSAYIEQVSQQSTSDSTQNRFLQGGTKVVVGVFGPKEVQRRSDFSVTGQVRKWSEFTCSVQ